MTESEIGDTPAPKCGVCGKPADPPHELTSLTGPDGTRPVLCAACWETPMSFTVTHWFTVPGRPFGVITRG